jgi:polyhydroxyalkanoate synthesis regulator phasin
MHAMAASDPWKRYLDAGLEITSLTRKRAEAIVRELVKAGEVQRHDAQKRVEELLDRSRQVRETVSELVRDEVQRQMKTLGLVREPAQKPAAETTKSSTATKTGSGAAKKATGTAKKTTGAAKKAAGAAKKKATGSS